MPILGPTGDFPEGQLNPDDLGGLQLGITVENGKVVMNFGTPVKWIGMSPSLARAIAASLVQAADRCPSGRGTAA